MKTKIFYFSATGNSLNIARQIAAGLGEVELVSIPKVINNLIDASAPKIGLVFPVYAWGMPRIVADFLKKIKLDKEQYIFAIAVSAGTPGGTLKKLKRTLNRKGSQLNAGFAIKEASYALLSKKNPLIGFIKKIAGETPKSGAERFPEIITTIRNKHNHRPETSSWMTNFFGGIIHNLAIQTFKTGDKDYWVDENCNNCRTCERICPRGNIIIKDGRPVWNHDCELCFACIQWCPREAIQYQNGTQESGRSHNPEIKLKDILSG